MLPLTNGDIKKYVILMETYLARITPNVSNVWRTDVLYLKVKGNLKYLYAIMDDDTPTPDTKNITDVQPLFAHAKEITGKRPNTLINDGAPNFHVAFKKEFATHRLPTTRHIRHIRIQGDHNNSKMERMNSEVREREKTTRGLKKADTKILPDKFTTIISDHMRSRKVRRLPIFVAYRLKAKISVGR